MKHEIHNDYNSRKETESISRYLIQCRSNDYNVKRRKVGSNREE